MNSRTSPLAALACVLALAACGDDPGTAAPAAAPSPSAPEAAPAAPASSEATAASHAREAEAPALQPAAESTGGAEVDNPDLVLERRSPDVRPGNVRGRVVLRGTPPAAASFSIDAKLMEECCGPDVDATDRSLVVDAKGGLANAVVEVMLPGDSIWASGPPIVIALERCQFAPRVQCVPLGATVAIENRDRGQHVVRSHSVANPSFNVTIAPGQRHTLSFGKPERIRLTSELVPWATGWVVATYSRWICVTRADGSFEMADVPSGEYALRAWHEVLGEVVLRDVTIGGGQLPDVEIAFER